MRPGAGFALVFAAILIARETSAEPAPRLVEGDVTLDYRRGPKAAACPDEAALRERAADAFDFHDPFVPHGQTASAHMRVEIDRAGVVYRGKVMFVDDEGRILASSAEEHVDCDALVWVLGHRVALAVLRKPPPASPAETRDAAPPPVPTPVPIPVPPPPPVLLCDARCADQIARSIAERLSPPPPPSLTVLAGGLVTAGWASDPGPGAWAGVAMHLGSFSLGFEARGTLPARAITFDVRRSASIATVSGAVLPCVKWEVLSGCALVEVGSYMFLVPSSTPVVNDTLVSLGLRAALDAPLGAGFSLRAFADLALHPYLPIFTVRLTNAADSPVRRWVTPIVSGVFGLGIGWSR